MNKRIRIISRVILIEQEGGYAGPQIQLQPECGEYVEPKYLDYYFEELCGKELRDVEGYEPKLDCGIYDITIKKIE